MKEEKEMHRIVIGIRKEQMKLLERKKKELSIPIAGLIRMAIDRVYK